MSKGSSDRNRIQLDIPSWIEDGRKKERNMEIRIGDGMTDLTPDAETPDPVRPEEGKTDIVLPDAPADSVKPPAQTEQAESTGSAESAGDRGGLAVKTRKLQAAAGRMAARAADWTREDVGSLTWQKNVLLAAIVIVAVLGSYAAAQFYRQAQFYQDHFREGTRINGMDVSNKTAGEVEASLEEQALDYSLTLSFRGGEEETLTGEDFAYRYVSDGSVAALMEEQDAYHWYEGLKKPDVIDAQLQTQFDRDTLRESLQDLPALQEKNMEEPEDAYRVWDRETHSFVIVPEEEGTSLDAETVFEAACEAIEKGDRLLDVEKLKGAYAQPAVRESNKALQTEVEQLNSLVGTSITWETPAGDVTLDGETLQDWLKQDKNGNYSKDTYSWNSHIREYVTKLAASIDSFGKARTFETTSGEETVVDGNDYYGWQVDQEAEIRQLRQDLNACRVRTREPAYLFREAAPMSDHDGVGDTYVEVDLSRQHLWMYVKGKKILETDVISGRMSEARHTPEGIFYPLSMQQNVTLRGNSGGETWAAPVSYWMKLTNDGVGLHDATWQWTFGGDFYYYNGSHGCINLPLDMAAEIYENLTMETPVVMYYSEPYELY